MTPSVHRQVGAVLEYLQGTSATIIKAIVLFAFKGALQFGDVLNLFV